MFKSIISCLAVTLFASPAISSSDLTHSASWCASQGGQHQKVLIDGTRVDCLLDDYAVEVEHAEKFYEGVGQALHYSTTVKKNAGLVIVLDAPDKAVYVKRLEALIAYHKLSIKVWRLNNFEEIDAPGKASESASADHNVKPADQVDFDSATSSDVRDLDRMKTTEIKVIEAIEQEYSCSERKTCSQIRSCGEALYLLKTCGFRRLDGDNDGVPCEKLCR